MINMPVSALSIAPDASLQRDLRLQMTVAEFGVAYGHCDRIANYLARCAADRDADVDRAGMRISAIFNEVLEAFYRHGGRGAQLCLDVERTSHQIALHVHACGNAEIRELLRRVRELVRMPDARSWCRGELAQGVPDIDASALALVDMVASGQGHLEVSEHADATVRVTASLDVREHAQ